MGIVLKRTVACSSDRRFDNLSGSYHQSQVESCLSVKRYGSVFREI